MNDKVDKKLEKKRLFHLLRYFFCSVKITPEIEKLQFALSQAKSSDPTNHAYNNLLDELHQSTLIFPGFRVERRYEDIEKFEVVFTYDMNSNFMDEFLEFKRQVHSKLETLNVRLMENSSVRKETKDVTFDSIVLKKEDDVYNFIMLEPFSLPCVIACFTFILQIGCFCLAVEPIFINAETDESDFKNPAPFGLPDGVDSSVHASQFFAILIVSLVTNAVWESTADLFNGYNLHWKEQGVKKIWWAVSNLVRLFEGLVATFVTFLLIIMSENNVDLFKDFTAMIFISELDNMVCILATQNLLGERLKVIADRCEDLTYEVTRCRWLRKSSNSRYTNWDRHKRKIPPAFVFLLLVTMYGSWLTYILIPHMKMTYLCQDIHLQFDDEVDVMLSYYSGPYELLRHGETGGQYPIYVEKKEFFKKNKDHEPMAVRYCENLGSWVLVSRNKGKIQCDADEVLLQNSQVSDQQKFNLFLTSSDDWEVRFARGGGKMIEKESFRMSCRDQEQEETPECGEIQVDDNLDPFVSSREWSRNYLSVKDNDKKPLFLYGHEVFYSETRKDMIELILYLGKRWAITTSLEFQDRGNQTLQSYLKNNFHGAHSNYSVTFLSEPVTADTPMDMKYPVSLKWYMATPKTEGGQQVDISKQVNSVLICSQCSTTINPCFYGGVCNDETMKCNCTIPESNGTLCQVLPIKNGFCNEKFNVREFDYDGGDCCINTCISGKDYSCGFYESGHSFVGYDLCQNSDGNQAGWHRTDSLTSFYNLITTSVSVSRSGRSLAMIDSISHSVRVYDSDGSEWKMRSLTLTDIENPLTTSVHISDYDSFFTGRRLPPVTVAIFEQTEVSLYDWRGESWVGTGKEMFQLLTNVKQIELRNHGNVLGILSVDNSFKVIQRLPLSTKWYEIINVPNTTRSYKSFSMSEKGDNIALLTSNCIEVIRFYHGKMENETCFSLPDIERAFDYDNRIVLKLSPRGDKIAILVLTPTQESIFILDPRDTTKVNQIRGQWTFETIMELTDDGKTITTNSGDEVRYYEFIDNKWSSFIPMSGSGMSASTNSSVIAVLDSTLNDRSPLQIYYAEHKCYENEIKMSLNFVTDRRPEQLSVELLRLNSKGERIIEAKSEPFVTPKDLYVVYSSCISDTTSIDKDDCYALKIIDQGLDGLNNGEFGVIFDREKYLEGRYTDGYESYYLITRSEKCEMILRNQTRSSKKYQRDIFQECMSTSCEWENFKSTEKFNGTTTSMSADGSFLAIGNTNANNNTGQVSIFHWRDKWVQIGLLSGNHTGDRFGQTIAMSASGEVIAITSLLTSNANGENSGRVSVYKYHSSQWSLFGNSIDGELNSRSGWTISLSGDGDVVAFSTYYNHDSISFSNEQCHAYVYDFDERKYDWIKRGDCFNIFDRVKVKVHPNYDSSFVVTINLSSNGLVLAIGVPNAVKDNVDLVGHVEVYEFKHFIDKWIRRGEYISGDTAFHFLGYSMHLTPDGSSLVVGGFVNYPIKVFDFHHSARHWRLRASNSTVYSNDGITNVRLSADGLVQMIGFPPYLEILIYYPDERILSREFYDVPQTNLTSAISSMSFSSDLSTIAMVDEDTGDVSVFGLRKINPKDKCTGWESLFSFEITPDLFAVDLAWVVINEQAEQVIIGGVKPSHKNKGDSTNLYQLCLPRQNIYAFRLFDFYGDGICCAWGNGEFSLKWSDEVITNSNQTIFSSTLTTCFPQSPENELVNIHFPSLNPQSESSSRIILNLLDEDFIKLSDLLEGDAFFLGRSFPLCMKGNSCRYLVVYDPKGVGTNYTVEINNALFKNNTEPFEMQITGIGNCNPKFSCPSNQQVLSLDLVFDQFPHEVSWFIFDSNDSILAQGGNYGPEKKNSFHKIEKCIITPDSGCITFVMIDISSDGGTGYRLNWDNELISGHTREAVVKHNLTQNCNVTTTCEAPLTLFELSFLQLTSKSFEWQITYSDSNDLPLLRGSNYTIKGKFYEEKICFSFQDGECYNFTRLDSPSASDENAVILLLKQNSSILLNKTSDPFKELYNSFTFGNCSDS